MANITQTPQGTKGGIRDWIDPTRIYNTSIPVERIPFLWGLAIYPFMVIFIVLTPIIIVEMSTNPSANVGDTIGIVTYLFMLAWVTAAVCICLRRLRYFGMSQRWVWLIIPPIVNLVLFLYLFLKSAPADSPQAG